MIKSVPKEVSEKYIEGYFKKKYPIDESKQPFFWEAVKKLCEDASADVSELINEKETICIQRKNSCYSVTKITGMNSVTDLAKKISCEIINSYSRHESLGSAYCFILEKRIKQLEREVNYLLANKKRH